MADVLISKSRSGQFIQGVKAPSTPSFVNGENPPPIDTGGDSGGGSFVPQTRELTINGTVFDLSQDRTWTIPTHDAVSIGTGNGLSLSGQQLSLGLASATTTGAVSSTDWNIFNNKEPSFTKNTGFNKNFGTASGTVAQGNDSRILNGQTAFGWGNHANAGYLTSLPAHGHSIANVTGLQAALDAKISSQWGTNGTRIFYNGGNVGVGTSDPAWALQVNKNANSQQRIQINNTDLGSNAASGIQAVTTGNRYAGIFAYGQNQTGLYATNVTKGGLSVFESGADSSALLINAGGTTQPIYFGTNGARVATITSSGSILINQTVSTGERLQVNGDIRINQSFGLMLIAPNGSKYKVTVNNTGTLITTLA